MIEKEALLESIIQALRDVHQMAVEATQRAIDQATDKEAIARSKYETFGLEASYLAHGQALRVAECEADILAYRKLPRLDYSESTAINQCALVTLINQDDIESRFFIGPSAGGVKVSYQGVDFSLITPTAPLGKAIIGLQLGDEFELNLAGKKQQYEIIDVK
ncbi:transcription elongation factor [Aliivibrio finisterrensis]|jgi:transcription elongation GreA/GreB family factor|uniref:Transcription elongation factor n=1 Tax=Aliivibrio finisterrensis TaxID=511998 RepID=A0A4V1Z931_9GAMM|nr:MULTISPECIES: GreA/GreB family elongation factor [Aliivibrio]MDD9178619.1 GreA/GreB family elongation factor [Aliivibrio sp. A6]RYU53081.1 transcription elongation factor [Aliivibrio finisterrensis]RYU55323.1 transcription elongation factor [Aliivibrio finisterrensis]RYU60110.1 transcription elongation factor [Aliivibrio finisterrensis]RYU63486.1 transcription elongation factor [Aliivibrio finisterrensis]